MKTVGDSKTVPQENDLSLEELEALTNPASAPNPELAAALQSKKNELASGHGLNAGGEFRAFEMPAGKIAKGESFTVGAEVPVSQMSAPDLDPLADIRAQLAELSARVLAQVPDPDVLQADTRAVVYCPECKVMLEGGAATGQAGIPYRHPHGSAAPKECKYQGREFAVPKVSIRLLPPKVQRRSIPA